MATEGLTWALCSFAGLPEVMSRWHFCGRGFRIPTDDSPLDLATLQLFRMVRVLRRNVRRFAQREQTISNRGASVSSFFLFFSFCGPLHASAVRRLQSQRNVEFVGLPKLPCLGGDLKG